MTEIQALRASQRLSGNVQSDWFSGGRQQRQGFVRLPWPIFCAALLPLAGQAIKPAIALARLDAERGFQWLIAPEEAPPPPSQTKPREPGAPSLRKYNPARAITEREAHG